MKFLSSVYPFGPSSFLLLFISCLGFIHFSFSLSPPNSRFSLEDQFSDDDQTETTTLSSLSMESGESVDNLSGKNVTSRPFACVECGIRGVSEDPSFLVVESHEKSDVSIQQPFVINGKYAYRTEFPWLAALTRYREHFPPKTMCAASLITSNFLVTAAHCILGQRKDRLRLVFNALEISPQKDVREDDKVIIMKIKRLIPHPKFNKNTVDNDVGLIELEKPFDLVKMKDIIRPVCLPSDDKKDYAGIMATVAGWGYTNASGVSNSPNLLKADIPIISNEICQKTEYGMDILKGMLCAGFDQGGTDACTNDSGGPLVIQEEDGKNILVGLVSWGNGCGQPKLPGVYTRVTEYINWIKQQLKGESRQCIIQSE